jgi:hypothetical protein
VNFFQPSLKLLSKERNGAKVSKKYDTAKTPHQRVVIVNTLSPGIKDTLNEQYEHLDPVALLEELKRLQSKLFEYAWCGSDALETIDPLARLNNSLALPELHESSNNINEISRE